MSDPEIDRAEEAEALALEHHDAEHYGDPAQYWGECQVCAERVDVDVEAGVRCARHGLKDCGPCEVGMQLQIDKAIDNDIDYAEHNEF